ncbi:hypothetical protein FACS1894187_13160 [Synergistales bacterium]|nr:hypothetical protein FACS1894187_13160 [Synergistales bacterium]
MMNLIATGMLQILALKFSSELRGNSFSWLRTVSKTIPTEASIAGFLRRDFFVQFVKKANLGIVQIIRSKMKSNDDSKLSTVA